MWGIVRVVAAIALLVLILYVVVSPYIDLPLTTLRGRQLLVAAVGLLAACCCVRGMGRPASRLIAKRVMHSCVPVNFLRGEPLRLTCELLC